MNKKLFNNFGFTLVEMSIVLIIVGLLVGLGSAMIGPMMSLSKNRDTKEFLGATVESVNSWAASNNRLPDVTSGAASPTFFTNVAKMPLDAWGRNFIYLYDSAFATAPFSKDTVCGRRTTSITLQTIDPAATIQNVAFVVMSRGEESLTVAPSIFTILDGVAVTASAALSTPPTPRAIVVPANTDDIVRWVTLDELRSKIGCQGAQLKILNNEVPAGTTSNVNVSFAADGGVPFATSPSTYKWCINTLPAGLTIASGGIQNSNCWTASEATWGVTPAQNLIIMQTAGLSSASYQITIVVRDNADNVTTSAACNNANPGDNCASKSFVLTVSP